MNLHNPISLPHREPVRHKLTSADWRALDEAGLLDPDIKMELIDGELIEMPEDGFRPIVWNALIARWLFSNLPDENYWIIPDKSLRLDKHNVPSPDFYVFRRELSVPEFNGPEADLVIEIADTTVRMDTGKKRDMYASQGIRDYWVILCEPREIWIYRQDKDRDGRFLDPVKVSWTDTAEALLIPDLTLRLADFPELADDPHTK